MWMLNMNIHHWLQLQVHVLTNSLQGPLYTLLQHPNNMAAPRAQAFVLLSRLQHPHNMAAPSAHAFVMLSMLNQCTKSIHVALCINLKLATPTLWLQL